MSEPIRIDDTCEDDSKKSDFVSVGGSIISSINFKMAFFLFFIGMIIFSDLFISGVLSRFDDTISGECTTTKGALIQLTVLVLGFLVLDLLVKGHWL